MRKPHSLRANKRSVYPRHVIFYDNETKLVNIGPGEDRHELILGHAVYVDYGSKKTTDTLDYTDPKTFWDWVVSKCYVRRTVYVIAHNQDFDFRVVEGFSHLHALGFYTHKLMIEYPRFICTFGTQKKDRVRGEKTRPKEKSVSRKYITCLDTLNWFRESLKELGDILHFPKLEIEFDGKETEALWTYCRQDVAILRKAFEVYVGFLQENQMGTFGVTLAKQSINAFKTRFMTHDIQIHTHAPAIALERQGYFGGRTEAFRIGEFKAGPYYKLDINSMYPYVMRNHVYPVKLLGVNRCEFSDTVKFQRDRWHVIADVSIDTPYPAFPYRGHNKLLFPVGRFRTTLCSPELDLLDKMKLPYHLHSMSVYHCEPIFREFVDKMYALRQQFKSNGSNQYEYFVKILMNSLYGKFGQRNETWEPIGFDNRIESGLFHEFNMETGEDMTIKKILGECFKSSGMEEGFDSFVAISAFVTSYARVLLWQLICQAGMNHCYYTDTDSLIVDRVGFLRLSKMVDPKKLGYLKLEGIDLSMEIHNVKDYRFDKIIKIKGVSKKAKIIGNNRYLVEQWEHFNGAVLRNRPESVITKQVVKVLRREYEKGTVDPEGWVIPYFMNEGKFGSA